MTSGIQKSFAVTLAFGVASLTISGLLFTLAHYGSAPEFARSVDDWGRLALVMVGDATLAGLAVDIVRFAATRLVPKNA